jgi:hypothetical protein
MLVAFAIIGIIGVVAGMLAVGAARFWPQRQILLEDLGGGVFLAGAALLGASLPMI